MLYPIILITSNVIFFIWGYLEGRSVGNKDYNEDGPGYFHNE